MCGQSGLGTVQKAGDRGPRNFRPLSDCSRGASRGMPDMISLNTARFNDRIGSRAVLHEVRLETSSSPGGSNSAALSAEKSPQRRVSQELVLAVRWQQRQRVAVVTVAPKLRFLHDEIHQIT